MPRQKREGREARGQERERREGGGEKEGKSDRATTRAQQAKETSMPGDRGVEVISHQRSQQNSDQTQELPQTTSA